MWCKIGGIYKTSSISSIFIKTFWFFFVKDLTNRLLFPLIVSFWEHNFLARMRHLKNGWPLSAPPRVYFYHPQLLKKNFGDSWHQTAFTKKHLRSFDQNWRNTRHICTRWAAAASPPGFLGLKRWSLRRRWEDSETWLFLSKRSSLHQTMIWSPFWRGIFS